MKLHITTNVELDVTELSEYHIVPTVVKTTKKLRAKYNQFFGSTWGDFDFVRLVSPQSGYDARAFVTSKEQLRALNIMGHIGMYDLVDQDGVLDFYLGIPSRLDTKAKENGFKTNLARLCVHEMCHGLAQKHGKHDNTHDMEEEGRLIEYWDYLLKLELNKKITLLDTIATLLQRLSSNLQPLVQRQANKVLDDMEKLGHPVRIVEGYRSFARQNALYQQGRTTPGDIVTNAKAGESYHNYGVAVDFAFVKEGYDAPSRLWTLLGKVVKKHGFEWGGEWAGFVDKPHAQMSLGYTTLAFKTGAVDYKKLR